MRIRPETTRPPNALVITGHFREGPGYAVVRPAGTDDFLLMLTLGGRGRIGYGDRALSCVAGDLSLIRPGTMHDYRTDDAVAEWEFIWAHFVPRPHQLAFLNGWLEIAPGLIHLPLASAGGDDIFARVRAAILEMHRRAVSGMLYRDQFALNSLEDALLWCDTVNPRRLEARLDPRVSHAMQFLQGHLAEPIALRQLAELVHLSESRFSHLFRAQAGETPQQFLETKRIERAQQLLALSGLTISAVADAVGYENPFYFTLRFKKRAGCSPSEWRLRERERANANRGTAGL